jgi:hypothetical protein
MELDLKNAIPVVDKGDGTVDTNSTFDMQSAMPVDLSSTAKTWAIMTGDKSPEDAFNKGFETAKTRISEFVTEDLVPSFERVFPKPVKDILRAETYVAFPQLAFLDFVKGVFGAGEIKINKFSDAFTKFPVMAGVKSLATGEAPNLAESLVRNFHVTNPFVADMVAGVATAVEAETYFGALSKMGEVAPEAVNALKTSYFNAGVKLKNRVLDTIREGYKFQNPAWDAPTVEENSLEFFRRLSGEGIDGFKVNTENPFSLMRSVNDIRKGFNLDAIMPEVLYSDMTGFGAVFNAKEIQLAKDIVAGAKLKLPKDVVKKLAPLGLKGMEAAKYIVANQPKLSPKEGGVTPTQDLKGGQGKERGFTASVKEEMPSLEKVAGQYIPRSTDELAIKARTLIQDDLATAQNMASKGTDDASIATGAELLKYYVSEAENATGLAKDAIYEKATDLANSMAERLTELGRSVQAASILARLTPEGQVRFAAKTIQKYNDKMIEAGKLNKVIPELTPKQAEEIVTKMKEIQTMPEGEKKAIAFMDLRNKISDLVPTPLMDKLTTVWKAGLLTGLKTTGVNVLANISHGATEAIKDIPATLIDMATSIITKKRSVAFTTKGYVKGSKEGAEKGWRFLKTGYDERNVLTKYDYKRIKMGDSKLAKGVQKYEEFVFKLLGAEDQPFYYGAKMRSLYEQAKVEAINKGLKGKEAEAFIDNLVMNPTDDMVLLAVNDAQIAVFQNETAFGKIAKGIQNLPTGAAEFILPFGKTPSAVATQIINYTPIGAINTIIQNMGKDNFNQRDFAKGLGRAVTGTGILGLGYWLYNQGMVNLDRPKSEAEQKRWEAEGRTPNTIKVGGAYRQIQILGPAGNVLLVGAHFAKGMEESGSVTEALAKGAFGSIKSFTEQTFLQSVNMAMEAVSDPERGAASFINSFVGSWVPTIVKDVAEGTDKTLRRAESTIQKIIERMPILRYMLEPKVGVFGTDIARTNNFVETMADPTRPSKIKNDPVVNEIRRLVTAKQDINTTQLGGKYGYKSLSQKQNTEMWKQSGQIAHEQLTQLMQYDAYNAMPDDRKAQRINKIMGDAKEVAKLNIVMERTQGLEGEQLTATLKAMKKEGLLTADIFKKLMRLR